MLVDIKLRCMQISDPWGPHMNLFMSIFCIFVSAVNSPMLKKLDYMRSINTGRYLIQILIKFPFECHRNHVWGPIFDPSYDHFSKCDHF